MSEDKEVHLQIVAQRITSMAGGGGDSGHYATTTGQPGQVIIYEYS